MPDCKPLVPLMLRGFIGRFVGILSFGSIMLTTRLDKVGKAAILRDISKVFAALIAWYSLKEPVGSYSSLLMVVVGIGAIVAEFGG